MQWVYQMLSEYFRVEQSQRTKVLSHVPISEQVEAQRGPVACRRSHSPPVNGEEQGHTGQSSLCSACSTEI